jgi:hypothetical protein
LIGHLLVRPVFASSVDPVALGDVRVIPNSTPLPSTSSNLHDLSLEAPPIVSIAPAQLSHVMDSAPPAADTAEQTAVPLPTPVWTGLGGLAGLAVVRSGRFVRWFLG